mgnify:CR=1 FL=1
MATDDLEAAVRGADIVSCATPALAPLIRGEWLKPGQHIDLVGGFTPEMRESDDGVVDRARLYVDTYEALREAGDLTQPLASGTITEAAIAGDLAFTILLALFPFLIFASSLAGYFGEQVDTEIVVEQVLRFAPPVVAESLVPAIEHAVGARSGSAALLGMALGLVFAAMGVEAFRGALNTAFECHGLRPWWWRIIVKLLFVVVGSIGFLAATLVAVVWPVASTALNSFTSAKMSRTSCVGSPSSPMTAMPGLQKRSGWRPWSWQELTVGNQTIREPSSSA